MPIYNELLYKLTTTLTKSKRLAICQVVRHTWNTIPKKLHKQHKTSRQRSALRARTSIALFRAIAFASVFIWQRIVQEEAQKKETNPAEGFFFRKSCLRNVPSNRLASGFIAERVSIQIDILVLI
jgi:hypothetical protein